MSANYSEFDRELLVVVNPASTQFKDVQRDIINRLDESGWRGKYVTVETRNPDEGANNAEIIGEKLVPYQRVLVAAGDDTMSKAANSYDQAEEEIRRTGLLIGEPYGSGNDTFRSLNGFVHPIDPLEMLRHGKERPLDLISLMIDGQEEVLISYLGFGWTGDGAIEINLPENRARKKTSRIPDKVLDAYTLAGLALEKRFPSFRFMENGQEQEAAEITISNLPYMAGGVVKVEESEPGKVVCIQMAHEGFARNVIRRFATERLTGGLRGTQISHRAFTLVTDVNANLDGTGRLLKADSEIVIGVKPNHINISALPKTA